MKKCQGVFAGGGVRGIGHVGAVLATEQAGYSFENLAGSSAGAIVAALLAAGYTAEELQREMLTVDYLKFKQKDWLDKLGQIGKFISILLHFGIYNADYFENWLAGLLKKKGIVTFGDFGAASKSAPCRLQVTASDLLEKRVLVLPQELSAFGIDPMDYPVAKAVRMSMSIPIFYEPFRLYDRQGRLHYMVDGGMLSNYPVWILDDGRSSAVMPTFGFRFLQPPKNKKCPDCLPKHNLFTYCAAIVSTVLDGHDNWFARDDGGDGGRSIWISTEIHLDGKDRQISSTDFDITEEESMALFQNGYMSGTQFFLPGILKTGNRITAEKKPNRFR